jgi:hypothetical protein
MGSKGGLMHRIESSNYVRDAQGRNLFSDGPPGTTVNDAWLNTMQEELANVIEWGGSDLKTKSTDTRDQLKSVFQRLTTSFDIIISSQPIFNNIIERVSANRYRIKDIYKSVYFKTFSGGFKMAGSNSPLSGGDTWGYLETNQCELLFSENGTSIDFGNTQGYLNVNTNYCSLYNMSVVGLATVASAITQSFLNSADYVSFFNCKTFNRLSSSTFLGFNGNGKVNSKYVGCFVHTITNSGGNIHGFDDCHNLSDCYLTNCIVASVGTSIRGFNDCTNLNNCSYYDVNSGLYNAYGFYTCERLANCRVDNITSDSGTIFGFRDCTNLSSCTAKVLTSTSGLITGFTNCTELSSCSSKSFTNGGAGATIGFNISSRLSSCIASTISSTGAGIVSGFSTCESISSSIARNLSSNTNHVYGFDSCSFVTSSVVYLIDATGAINNAYAFKDGVLVSGCFVNTVQSVGGEARGFMRCSPISCCKTDTITVSGAGTAEGYHNCSYGSSLYSVEATNGGNDYMDTLDADVTNKISCFVPFTV